MKPLLIKPQMLRHCHILGWLSFGLLFGVGCVRNTAYGSAAVKVLLSKNAEGYDIRYLSGGATYDEQFSEGMLHGRFESPKSPSDSTAFRGSPAFQIQIKEKPSPPAIPGQSLGSGWQWIGSTKSGDERKGKVHFAIELSNSIVPLTVVVHTLLDGTPVFTRWLQIRNASDHPIALTGLAPWSGQLWGGGGRVVLGHSVVNNIEQWRAMEGWFGWTNLALGTNTFIEPHGLAYDDPYFVLRNDDNGEFCIGELAWGMSYFMEFALGDGVNFGIGPYTYNALRVIAPGETIATPAVHVGGFSWDFDSTVQAMQNHIRRSVLPVRDKARAYRIECLMPGDRQSIYGGDAWDETNIEKSMDVAAAAGCEVFIVDGPTWAEGYGNWVPKKKQFPNGLGPLRRYAHRKGMLFGLYAEPEGGRGDWSQTQAFKEHTDWFVLPGYLLNLENPEAAAYMEQQWTNI
ncbi:MAG: alpha-galactosidase, partial [Verrucomicrobiota bacterium]|nr:alpha-galactosidase [Verrucomicrobiota bacterium]